MENILWRVENSELDGANPKVIVLLAGIYNVGTVPGGDQCLVSLPVLDGWNSGPVFFGTF